MSTAIPHGSPVLTPFETATVGDAMTAGVISCPPDTPLSAVAQLMVANRIHSVFVFDECDDPAGGIELWGIVSDLDVVAAAWADLDARTARNSAVTPLVTIANDDRLQHASQRMAETGVSHLAVLDPRTMRPVGVLSTLDVIEYVAARDEHGRG